MSVVDETGRLTLAEVGATEILEWLIILVVATSIAYVIYRAMERPRLRVVETPQGQRATLRDTVQYSLSIPILVLLWIAFFTVILSIADNGLDAFNLAVLPAAIVMATRLLAHVNPKIAHELGKAVPLTLITLILIAGGVREENALLDIIDELAEMGMSGPALVLVFVFDYVITALWYWIYVRWWKPRSVKS
jgi:Na+/H+ antiporter NhaD/arsenite permease-like protein